MVAAMNNSTGFGADGDKVRPTVLVVDDQPENIDVLSNILRSNYKVKAATNGSKALQIIQQKEQPDLILLDIMMPGMDGYEVCQKLKEQGLAGDIPVIFVSALQNVEDRVRAFTSGGVDYITKPVQPEEVKARVRVHVQLKLAQQQLKQANDELEARVKERTREVEVAYDNLHESFKQIVESENKYRSLLDAAPDGVILVDEQGLIEMVNREACLLFCYDANELVGQGVEILIPSRAKNFASLRLSNLQDSKPQGPIKDKRLHAVRKDGSEFLVDVNFSPIETSEGVKLIVDVRDITEREQLYAQLQQAQKMEAIGLLTGGIAHDFNNMLASIMGFTQLAMDLSEDLGNDKLNEYLQEVNQAGERARDLIAQMLSFSRRNAEKELLPLKLAILIKEVVSMLRPMLPSSIGINYKVEGDIPMVKADPVKIHQVLMNLCINARDAIDGHGRIDLYLRLGHMDKAICSSCHNSINGEFVEIAIVDNGPGIKKSHLNKIFDPFFTTKEVGKGTGMGLSVVHGIMHDHLGHIVLESRSAKGTTFRLLFPPADADEAETEQAK